MTMSLVGKPTAVAIRAADDAAAPGSDPATAEGFAGIVAAIVAGGQVAPPMPPGTTAATVPTTGTTPSTVPTTGTTPSTAPQPGTASTLPTPGTAATAPAPVDGGPEDKAAEESDAARAVDPAALAIALAGAPVAATALNTSAAATAAGNPVSTTAQSAGPVRTATVGGLPVGGQPDAAPSLGADAASDSDSHASPDDGGARPSQSIVLPVPSTTPVGTKAASVADTLSARVAKIAAAKTSDPAEVPAAVAGQVAPVAASTITTAAVAPTAAAPGSPAGTAAQLAPAVFAVHRRGVEGTHHMTVDITPDELGPVRLTVALRDGQLHVLLAGSSEVSREAMRAALPELRKLVEGAGITAGSFDVHPDQPDTGRFGAGTSGSMDDSQFGGSGSTRDHPPPDPGRPDRSPPTSPERRGLLAASRSLDLHL